MSHTFGDVLILFQAQSATNPITIWLVPDTPVPIANALLAPLFQAMPDDLAALLREPAHRSSIIERSAELRIGHHRRRAYGKHCIHIRSEQIPFIQRIGRILVEKKDADNLYPHFSVKLPDALTLGSQREVPPAIGLVHTVAKTHGLYPCVVRGYVRFCVILPHRHLVAAGLVLIATRNGPCRSWRSLRPAH